MAVIKSKRCSACGQTKPFSDYYRHTEGKFGLHPECKDCLRIRRRKWSENNRETVNAASRKWAKAHPEYRRNCARRHRERYPERHAARNNAWYHANRTLVLSRQKKYREENAEKIRIRRLGEHYKNAKRNRARAREWADNNRERRRQQWAARRARKMGLPCHWTAKDMEAAKRYWKGHCPFCNKSTKNERHWDHYIPLIDQQCPGTVAHNMLPLCPKCNTRKNGSNPIQWLKLSFPRRWKSICRRVSKYFQSVTCAPIMNG